MKKIGLTGGIGVGKTFVTAIFERMGYSIFSSDYVAKKIMKTSSEIKDIVVRYFGDEIYKDGFLQKEKLAKIIFSDPNKLNILNKLVHPFVELEFNKWCDKQNSVFVIKETAILFESGTNKNLDNVICVTAPLELRIERVMQRDKCTKESVMERINNQMSQDKKEQLSDFVILNDEKSKLLPQIINISKQLVD